MTSPLGSRSGGSSPGSSLFLFESLAGQASPTSSPNSACHLRSPVVSHVADSPVSAIAVLKHGGLSQNDDAQGASANPSEVALWIRLQQVMHEGNLLLNDLSPELCQMVNEELVLVARNIREQRLKFDGLRQELEELGERTTAARRLRPELRRLQFFIRTCHEDHELLLQSVQDRDFLSTKAFAKQVHEKSIEFKELFDKIAPALRSIGARLTEPIRTAAQAEQQSLALQRRAESKKILFKWAALPASVLIVWLTPMISLSKMIGQSAYDLARGIPDAAERALRFAISAAQATALGGAIAAAALTVTVPVVYVGKLLAVAASTASAPLASAASTAASAAVAPVASAVSTAAGAAATAVAPVVSAASCASTAVATCSAPLVLHAGMVVCSGMALYLLVKSCGLLAAALSRHNAQVRARLASWADELFSLESDIHGALADKFRQLRHKMEAWQSASNFECTDSAELSSFLLAVESTADELALTAEGAAQDLGEMRGEECRTLQKRVTDRQTGLCDLCMELLEDVCNLAFWAGDAAAFHGAAYRTDRAGRVP
ncbi:unnamed protein product [Polarella glacialis]|uniref:Uncharacterized protein n=1 Tax=Polarella glacialis TaxID=89957 RepID=A0A813DRE9_POLGL|nr:unnamed protein product [Polarella glacialis]